MTLLKPQDLDLDRKTVIVRADLDVGDTLNSGDDAKLETLLETLSYLASKNTRIVLIGHRGRPGGEKVDSLSLGDVVARLSVLLKKDIQFCHEVSGDSAKAAITSLSEGGIVCLENLRFDSREEAGNEDFARELARLGEVYINEAFSASHREHTSIVGIPNLLPHTAGFHFVEEIENLSSILDKPRRPVVVLLSGFKKDKLDFVEPFKKFADKILIAGRLPDYMGDDRVSVRLAKPDDKVISADLIQDKEDITMHSMEVFEAIIKKAGTVVVSGPLGKYEDEGHRQGTERVLRAVAASTAFKVAGGGDTEQAVAMFGLKDKFDWVSVGGGASMEFLAYGTLPGVKALGTD